MTARRGHWGWRQEMGKRKLSPLAPRRAPQRSAGPAQLSGECRGGPRAGGWATTGPRLADSCVCVHLLLSRFITINGFIQTAIAPVPRPGLRRVHAAAHVGCTVFCSIFARWLQRCSGELQYAIMLCSRRLVWSSLSPPRQCVWATKSRTSVNCVNINL